jgi:hypothetical protein
MSSSMATTSQRAARALDRHVAGRAVPHRCAASERRCAAHEAAPARAIRPPHRHACANAAPRIAQRPTTQSRAIPSGSSTFLVHR